MASPHSSDTHAAHAAGSMDITEQSRTFDGFVAMVTRAVILIIAILVFMALVNA
jgi:hypothetical protein